jgi:hypothetical protein
MWWIGYNNVLPPTVKLPPGSFAGRGYGGQDGFVIPAFDLVIVPRAARFQDGGPDVRQFGRLLWLILGAGPFDEAYLAEHNASPRPFVWTKSADSNAALYHLFVGGLRECPVIGQVDQGRPRGHGKRSTQVRT